MDKLSDQYFCHAFYKDLPNGRASGFIEVDECSLTFGICGQRIEFSVDTTEIRLGGANNRLVFFSHPKYPQWSFYTSDRSILKDASIAAVESVAALRRKSQIEHVWGWGMIALVGFLIVTLPLTLLLRMDIVSAVVARQIPQSWEASLGESAMAQYQLGAQVLEQKNTKDLLAPLVTPLLTSLSDSPYEYQFHIVENNKINAFALPGGDIVIHSALILKAETAEEFVGVLAHEIVHVEQQHGIRNVIGAAGIYILVSAILGDVSGVLALLSGATPVLLNQSYSRRFEREADLFGYELLMDAQVHPSGLINFFKRLKQQEDVHVVTIESERTKQMIEGAMTYLSTHPATEKRIDRLTKRLRKIDRDANFIDLSNAFLRLQNAVRQSVSISKEIGVNEN